MTRSCVFCRRRAAPAELARLRSAGPGKGQWCCLSPCRPARGKGPQVEALSQARSRHLQELHERMCALAWRCWRSGVLRAEPAASGEVLGWLVPPELLVEGPKLLPWPAGFEPQPHRPPQALALIDSRPARRLLSELRCRPGLG